MYEGQRSVPSLLDERAALVLNDIPGNQFVDLMIASSERQCREELELFQWALGKRDQAEDAPSSFLRLIVHTAEDLR